LPEFVLIFYVKYLKLQSLKLPSNTSSFLVSIFNLTVIAIVFLIHQVTLFFLPMNIAMMLFLVVRNVPSDTNMYSFVDVRNVNTFCNKKILICALSVCIILQSERRTYFFLMYLCICAMRWHKY